MALLLMKVATKATKKKECNVVDCAPWCPQQNMHDSEKMNSWEDMIVQQVPFLSMQWQPPGQQICTDATILDPKDKSSIVRRAVIFDKTGAPSPTLYYLYPTSGSCQHDQVQVTGVSCAEQQL